jgi:hypothetical protein
MKRKFVDSEGVLFKPAARNRGGAALSGEALSSETLSGEALNSAALSGETLSGEAQPLRAQLPEVLSSKSTGSEPPGSATEAPGPDTGEIGRAHV